MNRLRKIWQSAAVAVIAASPLTAFAQQLPPKIDLGFQGITKILDNVLAWMYSIFFAIAAIIIVVAAFNYLTAGGDEEKVAKAHKQFIFALVAIAVAIVSASVKAIVGGILNTQVP